MKKRNLFKRTSSFLIAVLLGVSVALAGVSFGATANAETSVPTDFTEVTWTDFTGLSYKEYVKPNPDAGAKGTYNGDLNRTLLNGNIIMGLGTDLRFAGGDGWCGLRLYINSAGSFCVLNSTFDTHYVYEAIPADYELISFADTEFNLKISTEIRGNDYTFGIWVNDKIVGDYFTLTEASAGEKGNVLSLFYCDGDNNITLKEVLSEEPDEEEPEILPPTDFTEVTWTDFTGLSYKEYVKPNPDAGAKGTYNGDLNRTLLNGNIIMGLGTDLRFAGGDGWCGLRLYINSAGSFCVLNSTFDTHYVYEAIPADYELISFADTEFNLKISTEIRGNDYTFGIWVNDKIVGDYFTLTEASAGEKGNVLSLFYCDGDNNITLKEVLSEEPDEEEPEILPPTDFTKISWTDFTGLSYKEYVKPNPDAGAKGTYNGDLTRTLLNGNIIMGLGTDLRFAGSDGWSGFRLYINSAGSFCVLNSTFDTTYTYEALPTDYGLETFADTEINLKISTEIAGNDYTFGIWVNDKMVGNYFTLTETKEGERGNILGLFYCDGENNITLKAAPGEVIEEKPIKKPPTNFTNLSWRDFEGLYFKEYVKPNPDAGAKGVYKGSLNKTLVNGNVTMGLDTDLRFAGSNGWTGLRLYINQAGVFCVLSSTFDTMYSYEVSPYDYGVETFADTEFNLKISTEIKGNDYTFGIWINDKIVGDYFTLTEANAEEKGNTLGLYSASESGNITLKTEKGEVGTGEKPVSVPKQLKEISFSSFSIDDAVYDEINVSDFCAYGEYLDIEKGKTLDGTIFHGRVKFGKNGGAELRLGGLGTAWFGLRVIGQSDGNIVIVDAEGDLSEKQFAYTFNPYDAGCALVGEWLDIQISIQFVDGDDDGSRDDVKLGVWFKGVLYMNEYIILQDYAPYMGSFLGVYCSNPEGYIAIKSVEVDNTISLSMFGFDDDYESYFHNSVKDKVLGEPRGISIEYETVDYGVDERSALDNVKLVDEGGDVQTTTEWIIAIVAAVVVVIGGILLCFVFGKKKRR